MRLSLLICLLLSLILYGEQDLSAQDCCEPIPCSADAQGFVDELGPVCRMLGVPPGDGDDTELRLRRLKDDDPALYKQLTSAIDRYNTWAEEDTRRVLCFGDLLPLDDEVTLAWISRVIAYRKTISFKSAEFCRGFGYRIEWGLGVSDLGKSSEGFTTALRALVYYTFAGKDAADDPGHLVRTRHCGGRFRIGAGLAESYLNRKGVTSGLVRMEFRVKDLAADLTSIGHVKLLLQGDAGITSRLYGVGIGAGFDVHYGGVQIMHSRIDGPVKHATELSLYYNIR